MTRPRPVLQWVGAGLLILVALFLWRGNMARLGEAVRESELEGRFAAPAAPDWKPAPEAVRKAAIAAIQGQLDAFKKDDYAEAVRYQSSGLKQNFASVEQFRQMMHTAYPQFARYRAVKYGPVRADPEGERAEVPVTLTGEDGVTVEASYMMVREEGEFRVEGVQGGVPLEGIPQEQL